MVDVSDCAPDFLSERWLVESALTLWGAIAAAVVASGITAACTASTLPSFIARDRRCACTSVTPVALPSQRETCRSVDQFRLSLRLVSGQRLCLGQQ